MRLEQQMQQLRLLQQAQQLEQQRIDLARQQRDLETQQRNQQQLQMQQLQLAQQRQAQVQQQQRQQLKAQQAAEMKAKEDAERERRERILFQQQQQQQQQQQKQQQKHAKSSQNEKYPVIFSWSHGGRDVYVAYSGDNWSQKYRMHRSHNDFSLIMEIQPGVYHYKFIVDNQWRCAPDQKHVRDANGAYSNVLDVRSHSFQQVIDKQKEEREKKRQKVQYQYAQNLPKSDQFVQDPPICPIHLHKVILNNDEEEEDEFDDNGKLKQKRKAIKINTMELPKPLRVSLNHLYVSDKREEEVVTLGMTERYKDKFFTTVYYTPIESRGTMDETFEVSNNYY